MSQCDSAPAACESADPICSIGAQEMLIPVKAGISRMLSTIRMMRRVISAI